MVGSHSVSTHSAVSDTNVAALLPTRSELGSKASCVVCLEKTGMEITLERVNLSFPLDLQLDGLKMLKPNDSIPQQKDTVADVKQLIAKVQLLPLLSNKVEIDELTFKQLKANTINFIGDLRIKGNLERLHLISHGIDLKGDSVRLNVAEIQGGWLDIALGDTVPEDTTKRKDAVAHQHRPAEPCKD